MIKTIRLEVERQKRSAPKVCTVYRNALTNCHFGRPYRCWLIGFPLFPQFVLPTKKGHEIKFLFLIYTKVKYE